MAIIMKTRHFNRDNVPITAIVAYNKLSVGVGGGKGGGEAVRPGTQVI